MRRKVFPCTEISLVDGQDLGYIINLTFVLNLTGLGYQAQTGCFERSKISCHNRNPELISFSRITSYTYT